MDENFINNTSKDDLIDILARTKEKVERVIKDCHNFLISLHKENPYVNCQLKLGIENLNIQNSNKKLKKKSYSKDTFNSKYYRHINDVKKFGSKKNKSKILYNFFLGLNKKAKKFFYENNEDEDDSYLLNNIGNRKKRTNRPLSRTRPRSGLGYARNSKREKKTKSRSFYKRGDFSSNSKTTKKTLIKLKNENQSLKGVIKNLQNKMKKLKKDTKKKNSRIYLR